MLIRVQDQRCPPSIVSRDGKFLFRIAMYLFLPTHTYSVEDKLLPPSQGKESETINLHQVTDLAPKGSTISEVYRWLLLLANWALSNGSNKINLHERKSFIDPKPPKYRDTHLIVSLSLLWEVQGAVICSSLSNRFFSMRLRETLPICQDLSQSLISHCLVPGSPGL